MVCLCINVNRSNPASGMAELGCGVAIHFWALPMISTQINS